MIVTTNRIWLWPNIRWMVDCVNSRRMIMVSHKYGLTKLNDCVHTRSVWSLPHPSSLIVHTPKVWIWLHKEYVYGHTIQQSVWLWAPARCMIMTTRNRWARYVPRYVMKKTRSHCFKEAVWRYISFWRLRTCVWLLFATIAALKSTRFVQIEDRMRLVKSHAKCATARPVFHHIRYRRCNELLDVSAVRACREVASNSLDRIYASCEIARQNCSDVYPYCHSGPPVSCDMQCSFVFPFLIDALSNVWMFRDAGGYKSDWRKFSYIK
jgi:hypothetical protein